MKNLKYKISAMLAVGSIVISILLLYGFLFFDWDTTNEALWIFAFGLVMLGYYYFAWTKSGQKMRQDLFKKKSSAKSDAQKGVVLVSSEAQDKFWSFVWGLIEKIPPIPTILGLALAFFFWKGYNYGIWMPFVYTVLFTAGYIVTRMNKWDKVWKALDTFLSWLWGLAYKHAILPIWKMLTFQKGSIAFSGSWWVLTGTILCFIENEMLFYVFLLSGISFFFLIFSKKAKGK